MNIKEKRVLVTGSSRGIGAETAKLLAEEGCEIIITYNSRKEEAVKISEKCKAIGATVHVIQLDVISNNSIEELFTKIDSLGGIDIVINNAGILYWKPLKDILIEEIESQIRVNVEGPIKIARRALNSGVKMILNIGSGAGKTPYNNISVYCSTKAAIRMFNQAADDVKMYTVNPGMTATEMTDYKGENPSKVAEVIVKTVKEEYGIEPGGEVDVWEKI